MNDEMSAAERKQYEGYVVELLEDAGVAEPTPGMHLRDLDKQKLDEAVSRLKSENDVSFKLDMNLSVSGLAREFWKATQSR
ncbi:hypothetical protein ACIPW4_12445 [Pseudomonas sp. NPDC089996]|uniref:hypothetical protein n=1 Tax=Pseudomonas sp. NPDC089996 TaxID=3364474 RepID=UPI00381508A7